MDLKPKGRESRLTFDSFVDKTFQSMVIGVAMFGINEVRSLNTSISDLNKNMGIVIDKLGGQEKRMDGFEIRLLNLETYSIEHRRARSMTK